ncbi:hypothetical protein [Terriglobus saanensis]|uniref:Uncharacterized protein n=1 Tax=Terriglobus saanensis (strain ATCC BAA-1853 / DSM 23119 / SP1PR4) TaxID=401053 RepID=E8V784_TERSS|nr:hypothetical protein [Terriglobus saanensis]ADV82797.1 hypothetical protein AciPR4_1993 [Terriglobus saanensis SP1PR4]
MHRVHWLNWFVTVLNFVLLWVAYRKHRNYAQPSGLIVLKLK